MISAARLAALDMVAAVTARRTDLPTAIARIRSRVEDERDRALAADIATGVQRWRAVLDHLIVAFAKRPLERLDPEVVDILRLSAYQLLYLTRVPTAAVVDDGVQLVKRAGKRSAAGFANAVLRAISRNRHQLPLPPRPSGTGDRKAVLDYFSVTLSHPEWLVARWYDRLGFDATERWLQFNNTAAPLTLRANRLKNTPPALADRLARDGIEVSPAGYAPDGLIVRRGHPLRGAGLREGLFVVQDEASQLVALLAGPSPGYRVLDTCAAPGGKTTALAAAMGNRSLLVACDVRPRRIALLRETIAACAATNVRLVQADLRHPLPFTDHFDCVLVDAPCSGLGTLRRDPDIKWRREERDLAVLAAAQSVMLTHAAAQVAIGGRLIYATCSSEPEENDRVVEAFLGTHPSFSRLHASHVTGVPDGVVDERGCLRTEPHRHGLEAFFGVVLTNRG